MARTTSIFLRSSVSKSTVSRWLNNKENFLSDLEISSTNPKRKKIRTGGYDYVDKPIHQWFLAQKSKKKPNDEGFTEEIKPWILQST